MIWRNLCVCEESESAAQQVSQKGCEETLYSTGYKHNRCSVRYLSI